MLLESGVCKNSIKYSYYHQVEIVGNPLKCTESLTYQNIPSPDYFNI